MQVFYHRQNRWYPVTVSDVWIQRHGSGWRTLIQCSFAAGDTEDYTPEQFAAHRTYWEAFQAKKLAAAASTATPAATATATAAPPPPGAAAAAAAAAAASPPAAAPTAVDGPPVGSPGDWQAPLQWSNAFPQN